MEDNKKIKEGTNNKIIHYFWFGNNPLTDLTKKCIESWKKYLPDFEIKAWNEENFDVNQCTFVKEAYEQKKWAFVTDYARFKTLEKYGGIYFDTDMEVTADISKYLENDLFMGCEDSKMINAAVVWAKEKNNKHISNIVKIYESMEKFNPTGDLYEMSVPRILTSYFEKYGFNKELDEIQLLDNDTVHIYPMEYFYPLSYDYQHNKFTDNSCMIHHFDATWISKMEKFKTNMKRKNLNFIVYIIDFFVALKNKIRFFCNYRDITVFITMFLTLMACLLSFKEISQNTIFSGNINISIIQVVVISSLWTMFCARTRNIALNFYCDKMTNVDTSNEEYKEIKLNLEQTVKFQTAEKIIYFLQYILTLILSFFTAFDVFSVIPSNSRLILYVILNVLNLYYIYIGINKNFKYRMLELIPYGLILASLFVVYPTTGILISTVTFSFVTYELFKNNVKLKRKKTFIISYIAMLIIALILNFSIPNLNDMKKLDIQADFIKFERVEEYDNIENNNITEFNIAKNVFSNRYEKLVKKQSLFLYPSIYVYLSIILSIIALFISKKKEYIFLGILALLNSFFIMGYDVLNNIYLNIFVFFILVLVVVLTIVNKFLQKEN